MSLVPGKSTPGEIRRRYDADVECFCSLETGESATVDAPLSLEVIAPDATVFATHGCGRFETVNSAIRSTRASSIGRMGWILARLAYPRFLYLYSI